MVRFTRQRKISLKGFRKGYALLMVEGGGPDDCTPHAFLCPQWSFSLTSSKHTYGGIRQGSIWLDLYIVSRATDTFAVDLNVCLERVAAK